MFATREQKRAYDRAWYAARRAAWFADKCCVVCGSTDRLELHHKDPAQKVSHRVWSWSQSRRDTELAKCEVRCHEHHPRGGHLRKTPRVPKIKRVVFDFKPTQTRVTIW